MIIILLIIYIRYYYSYPKDVAILQTTLNEFTMQILTEKQPIVIQDKVQDITELRKAWFNTNIGFTNVYVYSESPEWIRNKYKYLIIQPNEDLEILIYPPNQKSIDGNPDPEGHIVAVKLLVNQVIILPLHWKYHLEKQVKFKTMGVQDFISLFIW